MVISKTEKYSFKVSFGDKTIAINPVSKESKNKVSKYGSDIAISTLPHPDFSGFSEVSYKDKIPFKISGPGEYEVSEIFVKGFGISAKYQGEDFLATTYTIAIDGINLTILSPLLNKEDFSNEAYEEFTNTDILILPLGDGDFLNSKEAVSIAKNFSPKAIIPAGYSKKEDLQDFLKELGKENLKEEEKLTIKRSDLKEDEVKVVPLKIV